MNDAVSGSGLVLPGVLAALFACSLAPIFWPAAVAVRRRPTLPRRGLFVFVVAALCHGTLGVLAALIVLPVSALLVYVVPQVEAAGAHSGEPIASIARLVAEYWWIAYGPALVVLAGTMTRWLAARWTRIVSAMAS
ncbi:hypothetical protein FHW12_001009 [Dokdonella fugitiva]|uniref:Uncharacterized protein n=1 Tax=Dokdonella fugitiva TaxID=328517 RepID=A0A839F021_9GAMM|nr:hypothetical protein [Dokdonella fugitiva]MBA8886818.1 hypothetical protein [Dokdonella fugitiva]